MQKKQPYLLYSDDCGNIIEDNSLLAVGKTGNLLSLLNTDDLIEMPDGSDLFHLPGRRPIGWNPKTNKLEVCKKGWAVSAFIAPAYTIFAHSAWETNNDAPRLPLYAYAAVGWVNNRFLVPAIRIDKDIRQDCNQFNQKTVIKNAKSFLKKYPNNRLVKHLSHCALTYLCPAARNYFLNRWEAPLPTSPTCNSACVGCISYQPKEHKISASQNRITFVPKPDEIAEVAINHLNTAPNPIVSFGQGCEGEPLMVWESLKDAIVLIRKSTDKGIINLNTNASNPQAINQLIKVGLQSIRVSLNSCIENSYNLYYNPKNYNLTKVFESIEIAEKNKIWISLNYFVFPGVSDKLNEYNELKNLLKKFRINMIQWRNFNIDPEWYLSFNNANEKNELIGIKSMINSIKIEFPEIYHGYYNPSKNIIDKYL